MKNNVFDFPNYDGSGVYAIINVRKMFCYIGSSKNIRKRANEHNRQLKNNKHSNKILQNDYNNGAILDFLILERTDDSIEKDLLIAKEKMYMLESIENGFVIYNLLPKTEYIEQKEWIKHHLMWFFMKQYNAKENLTKSFSEKYGVTPAYMKNRKEENRKSTN